MSKRYTAKELNIILKAVLGRNAYEHMKANDPTWKELLKGKAKLKSDAEQEQVLTTVICKTFE